MANTITVDAKRFEETNVHQPIEIKFSTQGLHVILELPEGCNKAIIDARILKRVTRFFNEDL